MSLAEAERPEAKPLTIFGEITYAQMKDNAKLAVVVMKLIKEVCEHSKGRHTVGQITDGLITGACSVWGVMRMPADLTAIMVTVPHEGVLDVLLAGPDIKDLTPYLSRLEGIARSERCTKTRIRGPYFWKPHLPDGWRPVVTVFEKDIERSPH